MKRAFVISAVVFWLICLSSAASALPEEYREFADAVPEDIAELLPSGFLSEEDSERAEALEETLSPMYLIGLFFDLLSGGMGESFKLFAWLTGLAVLSSLAESIGDTVTGGELRSAVSFAASLCTALAAVTLQLPRIVAAGEFFRRICIVMNSMLPVMTALYLSGGNTACAAATASGLMLQLDLIELCATALVLPAVSVCMALTLADTLRVGGGSLSGIVSTIKHALAFVFGLCSTFLTATLSAQNILAAAGDNVGARAVKFVAGNMIPVVGSTVGESLRTLATSVKLLRSTVGISGMIVVALLLLPFITGVFLTRAALSTSAAISELLGCKSICKLYRELASLYGYLIAAATMAALLCVFSLTLFALGSTAIGGLG